MCDVCACARKYVHLRLCIRMFISNVRAMCRNACTSCKCVHVCTACTCMCTCCGCTRVCVHKHVHMQPCMRARLYCAVRVHVCTVCAKGADVHAHSTVVPAADVKPTGRFPRSPQCRVQAATRPGAGETAWRSRLRVGAASAAAEPKPGQGDRGRRPGRTPTRDPPSRTHPHAGAPRARPRGGTLSHHAAVGPPGGRLKRPVTGSVKAAVPCPG